MQLACDAIVEGMCGGWSSMAVDVVVVGAGLAGLVCAQQLQALGHSVAVLEKSRGVGGRVATRRLADTCADHGLRYWEEQGGRSQALIQQLVEQGILHQWTDQIQQIWASGQVEPFRETHACYYAAPAGATAVAKFCAQGLDIQLNQRVQAIVSLPDHRWQVRSTSITDGTETTVQARAVAIAIPAPQILPLLEPTVTGLLPLIAKLQTVQFDPCLSAIAVYPRPEPSIGGEIAWKAIRFVDDPDIAWVSQESSKRDGDALVFVVHSTSLYAQHYLDASDLNPAGHHLITKLSHLGLLAGEPTILQVHRWRYAFPCHGWGNDECIVSACHSLVCGGDWCGTSWLSNRYTEGALRSGLAMATDLHQQLKGEFGQESKRVKSVLS
jgi:hypothetical protein